MKLKKCLDEGLMQTYYFSIFNFQPDIDDNTEGKGDDGEFIWDSVVQSQIIGSFYYGYILTQVPGGRLAEVIGAKKVLAISMGGTAILT